MNLDNLVWWLYIIDVISSLPRNLLILGIFIPGVCGSVGWAIYYDLRSYTSGDVKGWWWVLKRVWGVTIPLTFFLSIIPSKETMYYMLGVSVTNQALNIPTAQRMVNVLNGKLEDYLKELEGKKK